MWEYVAELKVTVFLIISMALGVVGLVTYTLADRELIATATVYILCVANGGSNCSLGGIDNLNYTLPPIFILLSFLPMWSIMLTINFQNCMNMIKLRCKMWFHN